MVYDATIGVKSSQFSLTAVQRQLHQSLRSFWTVCAGLFGRFSEREEVTFAQTFSDALQVETDSSPNRRAGQNRTVTTGAAQ